MSQAELSRQNRLGFLGYFVFWSFAALWLLAMVKLAHAELLSRRDLPLLSNLQLVIVLPMLFFWLSYLLVPAFKHFVLSVDLLFLNALQCWRVLGGAILVAWGFGLLPGGFAIPMSVFDMSVGFFAVYAVLSLARRTASWRRVVLWTNIWGFFDFFITIGLALVGSSLVIAPPVSSDGYARLSELPISLFPSFFIPFFSCLHFMVFAQLYDAKTRLG